MKSNWKLWISIITPTVLVLIPMDLYGLDGLTLVQQRVIGIFFLAALFWVLEPIPIFATSILIIVLELLMVSTTSFKPFLAARDSVNFGELLTYQEIMGTFASPIIMLFLGGFFLAMAATKYRLDQNLARVMLKPFGTNPKYVMLGIMSITAVFSMFMSNTATTAMMLSILIPVLAVFDAEDKGKVGFALCIPFAANIGGVATPIGTPPNAVALKYLTGADTITFGSWMTFGVPFVLLLLTIVWWLITHFYPSTTKSVELQIKGQFLQSRKAYIVYVTFATTILMWLFDFIHGINAYTVGLIPVVVFLVTGIITKEDMKGLSWDVLWLVSGGIALGLALEKTGLATTLVSNIPFDSFSPYIIILLATGLALVMANFMSNTATANLLLPITAALGTALPSLGVLGGAKMLILGVTLATSMGMALPISTPPNALAHATGLVQTKDMTRIGLMIGIIGLGTIFLTLFLLKTFNFF
jgi:sodium-dependent dicarboxylate transporter 2/3/5